MDNGENVSIVYNADNGSYTVAKNINTNTIEANGMTK